MMSCYDIRITPAYAGKTDGFDTIWADMQDHPRLRGKNSTFQNGSEKKQGSPPLTREKLNLVNLIYRLTGITPAYAGKTLRTLFCRYPS